ncbi:MAG: adenine nucleotide alpha hydrolase [Polyangiaceae bacterium]
MSSHKPRAIVSWSSGKDSAFSLHVVRQAAELDVIALFTTVNRVHDRVAMHAVRRELLRAQAASAGLPLWEVEIPSPCSNEEYEAAMRGLCERAVAAGVEQVVFGDLFLEDIRRYREERLRGTGLSPCFPLWGLGTQQLALRMQREGLSAIVTCIDPNKLPASFAGRTWDAAFLADLPAGVDPCGENGEFHSFVTHGPMLRQPLNVRVGEVVQRDGFVFADVLSG